MAKKQPSERAKKYAPKLDLKEGVQWDDLINLSLKKPSKDKPKPATKTKKKK